MSNTFNDHYKFSENFRSCTIPFDPTEITNTLRYERYVQRAEPSRLVRNAYYMLRPFMSQEFRRILQRISLRDWNKIPFPKWPVDFTVEDIHELVLATSLKVSHRASTPFIWFWPDTYQACAIMTHDVETAVGRDFVGQLMDADDLYGIKASFQIVPEERYEVSETFRNSITERGFELNIHGLNHKGNLFANRSKFERQVRRINEYAMEYGARGFRSPVMYRNPEWFDALEFSYDMSVPNVGHLDPQRGGCCTVTPYFIGNIVELPLTTIQDYSLFNIIRDNSINLWKRQLDLILGRNGLASFLIHPDYIIEKQKFTLYKNLLEHLTRICAERHVWFALPRDVDAWWRQRNQMELAFHAGKWSIKGAGSERARLAFASLADGETVYQVERDHTVAAR